MRWNRCLLWGVVPLLLLIAAPLAKAAPEIPAGVYTADPISDEDKARIAAYVTDKIKDLKGANSTDEISKVRKEITDPLRRGGKAAFHTLYISLACSEIKTQLADHKQVVQKINAFILVAQFAELVAKKEAAPGPVLDLILFGLKDASPGVRLWAATAAERVTQSSLAASEAKAIRGALSKAILAEPSTEVAGLLFRSMANIPGAELEVLREINRHVDQLAQNPAYPFAADKDSVVKIYKRLLEADANAPETREAITQLMIVSVRYYGVLSHHLNNKSHTGAKEAEAVEAIKALEPILRWAHKTLNGGSDKGQPKAITEPLSLKKYADLVLIYEEWKGLIIATIKGVTAAQVDVQVRKPS